jgi:hypothetical protein
MYVIHLRDYLANFYSLERQKTPYSTPTSLLYVPLLTRLRLSDTENDARGTPITQTARRHITAARTPDYPSASK